MEHEASTIRQLFGPATPERDDVAADLRDDVLEALFDEPRDPRRFGRFVLLDRVGAGAMGTVYAAYDPRLDRRIALKLLKHTDDAARKQHTREARALARLDHPGVVRVHDAGEHDERLYVAMEFVEGSTLRDELAGDHPTRRIVEWFIDAGRGLAAAHEAGIVHRDFKPANVLIGQDGRVRVADFGLAHARLQPAVELVDSIGDDPDGSRTDIAGTPSYMAPEQLADGSVSPASDQFSFCAALYEALAGVLPYDWRDLERERLDITHRFPGPTWLRRAILRGLASQPELRHPNMNALLRALSFERRRRRRRVLLGGAAGLAVVGSSIGAAFAMGQTDAARPCADAGDPVDSLWTPAARRSVDQAFTSVGTEWAELARGTTLAELDAYSDELAAAHRSTCEDTWVRRESSEAKFDLTMACFDRARHRLALTIDRLAEGDVADLARADQLLLGLLASRDCSRDTDLPPLPQDAETREAIAKERAALTELRLAHIDDTALETAEQIRARAEAIDYLPLRIEATTMVGDFAKMLRRDELAFDSLKQALWMAQESRYDQQAATAAQLLADASMSLLRDPDAASDWLELAKALNRRLGPRRYADAELHRIATSIALQRRELAQAADLARTTEALAVVPRQTVAALVHQAEVAMLRGRADEAREAYQRAIAESETKLGPDHKNTGVVLISLAQAQSNWSAPQLAIPLARRAAAIFENESPPRRRGIALDVLAHALARTGKLDEALAMQRRAVDTMTDAYPERHPYVAGSHRNLANLLMDLGRSEEALSECKFAEEILRTHDRHDDAIDCVAEAHLALGQPDEALAVLRPSVERKPSPSDPSSARAWLLYGQALYAQGNQQEGVAAVRSTVAIYRSLSGSEPGELSAPESWLVEHGESP